MTINSVERNYEALKNFPVSNQCANKNMVHFSALENLYASTYSDITSHGYIRNEYSKLFKQSDILAEVMTAVAVSSLNREMLHSNSLTVALVKDVQDYNYQHISGHTLGGFYSAYYNILAVSGNSFSEINNGTLLHEFTHKAMSVALKSDNSNPYSNNLMQAEAFHQALKATIDNVKSYLSGNFNYLKDIENISYKQLAGLIKLIESPNASITSETLNQGILSYLKDGFRINDLTYSAFLTKDIKAINHIIDHDYITEKQLSDSLFVAMNSFTDNDKEIIKISLDNGAELPYYCQELLIGAVDSNNIELFKLIIGKEKVTYDEIVLLKEIIYYAEMKNTSDIVEILKNYISPHDSWYNYFTSFIPKISINLNEQYPEVDSLTLKNLATLTQTFFESYDPKDYDSEFIVTLPQIIAQGNFHGPIVEIMQPIVDYWHNEISPAILNYEKDFTGSNQCFVVNEGNSWYNY